MVAAAARMVASGTLPRYYRAMAEDLGSRLLRAGLVTREELARALERAPPHGGALATELVRIGIEEDALAGFFLAAGYGPLLDADEIKLADHGAVRRLDGAVAAGLLALPVRSSPAGLVVAMADPSDRHSVDEIRYAVGGEVLPTIARVSDLCEAIASIWPEVEPPSAKGDEAPGIFDEGEPIALVTRVEGKGRANPEPADRAEPHDWTNQTGLVDEPTNVLEVSDLLEVEVSAPPVATFRPGASAPRDVSPGRDTEPSEEPRFASARPSGGRLASSVAPEPSPTSAPPEAEVAAIEARAERTAGAPPRTDDDEPAEAPLPLVRTKTHRPRPDIASKDRRPDRRDGWAAGRSPLGQLGDAADRWSNLGLAPDEAPAKSAAPPSAPDAPKLSLRARKLIRPSPRKPSRAEFGGLLVTIRQSTNRDEIVEVACEAYARFGRAVVFLALARGILKGRHAIGVGLTRDAIRNLWIPATSPSTFKAALDAKEPWRGPHGPTAADQVFRAAIGSRGRELALWPIVVAGKSVALVAVDDPADPEFAAELFESIAASLGDAFQRIILTEKKA
jgi:hypothetical protein